MKGKKKYIIIAILVLLMIFIDQTIKFVITENFTEKIGFHLISINLKINTGMALGLNEGNKQNIIITIVVLILILNFAIKQKDRIDKKTAISLILIAAGGVSNLIDRFLYDGVVDYIDMVGFPIFNLADIYVVVGWILLVVSIYKFTFKNEEGEEKSAE